jgi:hypothetical protein
MPAPDASAQPAGGAAVGPGGPPEPADPPAGPAAAAGPVPPVARAGFWGRPAGRVARAGLVAVLVAAGVAWWARSQSGEPAAGSTPPAVAAQPPAAPRDLDQLAAALGCQARPTAQNSGYRQAFCVAAGVRYTLTTFSTDRGQQEWLSEALPYGGAYLVGTRWSVSATVVAGLPELASRLGGRIVDKTQEHHS